MFRVMALASLIMLASCHRQAAAPGDAPTGLAVAPGDGQVTVTWDQQPGLTYWIFYQAGDTVTAAAPGVPLLFDVQSPRVVFPLVNGTQYAFVMNATNQDSKAGPSTPVVPGFPRLAGATWNSGAPIGGGAPQNLNGLAFGTVAVSRISTARLVAVGNAGTIFAGDYNYTNASPPGVTAWTPATSVPAGFVSDLSAVIYTGPQFVALGADGSVLTSADSNTWTSTSATPSTPSITTNGARMNGLALGIVFGSARYVAVGAAVSGAGTIFTSVDLVTWTQATSNTPNDLFSVSFLNGGFVATGANGTLLTSPDASTWTVQTIAANTLRKASFGVGSAGARYVVVGDAGTILTSPDGTNWSPSNPASLSQDLRSVTFGSRFVAVGQRNVHQNATVAYSNDGTNWQLSSVVDPAGPADLNAVIFTPAMYAAVGTSGANAVSK